MPGLRWAGRGSLASVGTLLVMRKSSLPCVLPSSTLPCMLHSSSLPCVLHSSNLLTTSGVIGGGLWVLVLLLVRVCGWAVCG